MARETGGLLEIAPAFEVNLDLLSETGDEGAGTDVADESVNIGYANVIDHNEILAEMTARKGRPREPNEVRC